MTRKLFSATLLAVLLACFNACDNDTDEAPLPGALPYTKSYFVGLMNDSLISIKQDSYYDFRIDPLLYVPQDPYYQSMEVNGWLIKFAADYHDEPWAAMYLQWGPIKAGTFEITSQRIFDADTSERVPYIELSTKSATYICSPDHPFLLQVDDVDYENASLPSFPIVTGRMEGTLYNKDTPKDSVTFKDVEFRLWK